MHYPPMRHRPSTKAKYIKEKNDYVEQELDAIKVVREQQLQAAAEQKYLEDRDAEYRQHVKEVEVKKELKKARAP